MVLISKISVTKPRYPPTLLPNGQGLQSFYRNSRLLISDLRTSEERAKLKTSIAANLLQHFRNAMDAVGGKDKVFDPQRLSFALNQLSGFDYATGGEIASAISCHHHALPMMLRTIAIPSHNPNLPASFLPTAWRGLRSCFATPDSPMPSVSSSSGQSYRFHTALSEKLRNWSNWRRQPPVWPPLMPTVPSTIWWLEPGPFSPFPKNVSGSIATPT